MATITEDYVSFETAKLLKEKGFDEYCPESYFKMDKTLKKSGFSEWEKVNEIKAPTQSLAMKWLREVHKLHVDSSIYTDTDGYSEHEYTYTYWDWLIFNSESGRRIAEPQIGCGRYDSYEQACEAAIKYCLEHLI